MTNDKKWIALCKRMNWGNPNSYQAVHAYAEYTKTLKAAQEREAVLSSDWSYDPFVN